MLPNMAQKMRYPGSRGTVDDFFVLWFRVPEYFLGFKTPEEVIEHLSEFGFEMDLYRRRPSKKLAEAEKLETGRSYRIAQVIELARAFGRDTAYTREFLNNLTVEPRNLPPSWLRKVYRSHVDPGYAARLMSANVPADIIISAWSQGVVEEYASSITA